ncbi:hypothetical protein [Novosphingobium huizhouense]|uniref:hypothetical protein n=1 Tax=Novosphingobium huizhouense TaxID=2866625 RepID=UPI001CD89632|nr:hypothetical protein [Novosphingobium huizhouense]
MKINRTGLPLLLSAALAGCVAAPAPPPPPPPAPRSTPAAPPSLPAPAPRDWRDAAQTPGEWRYGQTPGGSQARFVSTAGDAIVTLRCDRAAGTVTLYRNGAASAPLPATITTTSESRVVTAAPVAAATPAMVALAFARNDRLLDAMAFSRGRFSIDINGLPVLYLPAWAELGRVVEDCRRV